MNAWEAHPVTVERALEIAGELAKITTIVDELQIAVSNAVTTDRPDRDRLAYLDHPLIQRLQGHRDALRTELRGGWMPEKTW